MYAENLPRMRIADRIKGEMCGENVSPEKEPDFYTKIILKMFIFLFHLKKVSAIL